jgi:glucose/arabinose dehydrogenase
MAPEQETTRGLVPLKRRRWAALCLAMVAPVAACGDDTSTAPSASSPAAISSATPPPDTVAASTDPPPGPIPSLALRPVATVDQPTALAVRPGSPDLYVLQQEGKVRRIAVTGTEPRANYALDAAPWLDLTESVTAGGEQGLLGIAFAPDGAHVYLAYTGQDRRQHLDEIAVDASGTARRETSREVLAIRDFAPNHNGGQLAFGPDGYLYWGMGDGGGGGDPESTGQDPSDLLGNILRIDPSGEPYSIPADNPFAAGGGAGEVFAYGLRNPWRFSFDPQNGDLWIGDVGQDKVEEIDRLPAGQQAGANLGWNALEGSRPFEGSPPEGAIPPVFEYGHDDGECSVTTGYVYRGEAIPGLRGVFLFGDYCAPAVRGLRPVTGGGVEAVDLGIAVQNLTSFGRGADGELFTLSLDGNVALLVAA